MKKWLIKTLKKILNKLEPAALPKTVVAFSYKSLVTLEVNYHLNEWGQKRLSQRDIKEILARQLSEQIIDYMDVSSAKMYAFNTDEEQVHYRATVQLVENDEKSDFK